MCGYCEGRYSAEHLVQSNTNGVGAFVASQIDGREREGETDGLANRDNWLLT